MNQTDFITELSKLRPSCTFLTLSGYRNTHDEIANYSLAFHFSYKNALEKSIAILQNVSPANQLESVAKTELIQSYCDSIQRMSETSIEDTDDAYTRFFDEDGKHIKGVKVHTETGNLHLYGLVVHKRVTTPGVYPPKKRKLLTVAKDSLRSLVPVSKFRQFLITPQNVERIAVEGTELFPPDNLLNF